MISISEDAVNNMAVNAQASANARSLQKKGAFVKYFIDADETLVFGECQGSGKDPYIVSVDFIDPSKPIHRCTCPSRQMPCKHALGILFCYLDQKANFKKADIPQDVLDKRLKIEVKATKALEEKAPKKVNLSALTKKIKAQIDGLQTLLLSVRELAANGLGSITPEKINSLESLAKHLGENYLPGPEASLCSFIRAMTQHLDKKESSAAIASNELARLRSLCIKGIEHLEKRLADPNLKLNGESNLDELLGHAWQLSELKELGLVVENAALLQLYFSVYLDEDRNEYVDSAFWIDVSRPENANRIVESKNLRPVKALKHLKEEDSFNQVKLINELLVYPGSLNPRVRWDSSLERETKIADFELIVNSASNNIGDAVKSVKAQLKNMLLPKYPVVLIRYKEIKKLSNTELELIDLDGNSLILADLCSVPGSPIVQTIPFVEPVFLSNGAALIRFGFNYSDSSIDAKLLSLITKNGITRLGF